MDFLWSKEKNEILRAERGVSFEMVVDAYRNGGLVDDFVHPDQERYPGQRVMAVTIASYVHLVPYVISDGHVFLKTVYPSRKANRQHKETGK